MSEPVELATYSFEDYTQRRCLLSEVGKVKYDDGYARRLARQATGKAMDALVEVVTQNDDLGAKVKAAQAILDRGFGKAEQHTSSETTLSFPEMPWLTARRLAYQESVEVRADLMIGGEGQGSVAGFRPLDASAKSALPEPARNGAEPDPIPE